jgi:hypothetical protein
MLLPSLYYCHYCTAPQPTSLKHMPSQLHHSLYTIPHYITMPLALLALHVTSHYICTTLHYIACIIAPLCITPCYIMEHCTSWSIAHHAPLCITPCYITLHLYTTLHYLHHCSTVHHTVRCNNSTTLCTSHPSHHYNTASYTSYHSHYCITCITAFPHHYTTCITIANQHASEVCYLHHYTNNTTCCISLQIISRHQSPQHAPH